MACEVLKGDMYDIYIEFQRADNIFLAYYPSSVQFRKVKVEASAMQ